MRRLAASLLLALALHSAPAEAALTEPLHCVWRLATYAGWYVSDFVYGSTVYAPSIHRYWWDFHRLAAAGLDHPARTEDTANALARHLGGARRFRDEPLSLYPDRTSMQFARERIDALLTRLRRRTRTVPPPYFVSLDDGGTALDLRAVLSRSLFGFSPPPPAERAAFERSIALLERTRAALGGVGPSVALPREPAAPSVAAESDAEIDRFYREFNTICQSGLLDPLRTEATVQRLLRKVKSRHWIDAGLVMTPPRDSSIYLSFVLDEVVLDLNRAARAAAEPDAASAFERAAEAIRAFERRDGNGLGSAALDTLAALREYEYTDALQAVDAAAQRLPPSESPLLDRAAAGLWLEAFFAAEPSLRHVPPLSGVLDALRGEETPAAALTLLLGALHGSDPETNERIRALTTRLQAHVRSQAADGATAAARYVASELLRAARR